MHALNNIKKKLKILLQIGHKIDLCGEVYTHLYTMKCFNL